MKSEHYSAVGSLSFMSRLCVQSAKRFCLRQGVTRASKHILKVDCFGCKMQCSRALDHEVLPHIQAFDIHIKRSRAAERESLLFLNLWR